MSVSEETHLDVAERFLKLGEAAVAVGGDHGAWTMVFAFYAAVHWVRAYIRHKDPSAQVASHDDVRTQFDEMPELKKVKHPYDTLKQLSQAVRYYGELSQATKELEAALTLARQVKSWAVPKCKKA